MQPARLKRPFVVHDAINGWELYRSAWEKDDGTLLALTNCSVATAMPNSTYRIMKRIFITLIAISSLASCATGPNAQTGTVVGGLGGAALGGIVGNQSGRGLEGAAIGAGLGALAGNAIGNSQDQRNYQRGRYYNNGRYYNQRGYRNNRYYYY
ncbi:YmgG-like glycine-zipper protein [Prosthecobacter fusiformis]|uniref:YmgG-like glycine-zipper protein n=2 Tax=Prosthecobacter fusiformis TaxID=48464 RepID=A0A4R7S821_9BACT|nr:YmgG-like glycine-zipper protein [Prosthecobacter fusiformis]